MMLHQSRKKRKHYAVRRFYEAQLEVESGYLMATSINTLKVVCSSCLVMYLGAVLCFVLLAWTAAV